MIEILAEEIDFSQGLELPVPLEFVNQPQVTNQEIALIKLNGEPSPVVFRFLTDHNVPVSLGHALVAMGHDVVKVSDVMPANSPDPVVAMAAIQDNRILISWDRDFNAQRLAAPRFAALTRIMMSGPEPQGATRITGVFDVVKFALLRSPEIPMIIRIGVGKVQIHV